MRALVTLAIMALAAPAAAQLGNPGFVMPGTAQSAPGVPAPNQTNTQDRLFAMLLAAGGPRKLTWGDLPKGKRKMRQ
jgi:putative membrane protein